MSGILKQLTKIKQKTKIMDKKNVINVLNPLWKESVKTPLIPTSSIISLLEQFSENILHMFQICVL